MAQKQKPKRGSQAAQAEGANFPIGNYCPPGSAGEPALRQVPRKEDATVQKGKARDLEDPESSLSRYLDYLNKVAAGKGSLKTIDLCDQKTAP